MCMQWAVVEYYNVKFYLVLEREEIFIVGVLLIKYM